MALTPKHWEGFQHYKDRAPIWIKLHRALLDNYEFHCLPVASRALSPMLWLLASEYEDGKITLPFGGIAFRLRMTEDELETAIQPLVDKGFFIVDSDLLADREQQAIPEKERETQGKTETEKETRDASARLFALEAAKEFQHFWDQYPNKVGKPKAAESYLAALRKGHDPLAILQGLSRYIASKPPDRAWLNPATFLNQQRWEDQPAPGGQGGTDRQERHSLRSAFDRFDAALDGQAEAGELPLPVNLRLLSG